MAEKRKAGLRYGEVEAILASILRIEPNEEKALRARLRHLRNIGVPEGITEPGRGAVIRFSRTQVLEMLLCLGLQKLGSAPSDARDLVRSIMKDWERIEGNRINTTKPFAPIEEVLAEPWRDLYAIVSSSFEGKLEFSVQAGANNERNTDYPFNFVINLSLCDRLLNLAIINTLS